MRLAEKLDWKGLTAVKVRIVVFFITQCSLEGGYKSLREIYFLPEDRGSIFI